MELSAPLPRLQRALLVVDPGRRRAPHSSDRPRSTSTRRALDARAVDSLRAVGRGGLRRRHAVRGQDHRCDGLRHARGDRRPDAFSSRSSLAEDRLPRSGRGRRGSRHADHRRAARRVHPIRHRSSDQSGCPRGDRLLRRRASAAVLLVRIHHPRRARGADHPRRRRTAGELRSSPRPWRRARGAGRRATGAGDAGGGGRSPPDPGLYPGCSPRAVPTSGMRSA